MLGQQTEADSKEHLEQLTKKHRQTTQHTVVYTTLNANVIPLSKSLLVTCHGGFRQWVDYPETLKNALMDDTRSAFPKRIEKHWIR